MLVDADAVALSTENLSLTYGRVRAVENLNLRVYAGEIYGFLGRNGAGKTSTIRMLMGLVHPDAGTIRMLDFVGRRIGVKEKRHIGYVSQEQYFYSWMTCRGLGRFVRGFYPTWDDTEFARLLDWLDLPPDRKVAHLSGGMKVKLALALVLAHRPPLLILDEPTSGLDPVARREFLEIIQRQARDHRRTTFFSSHLVDEVERVADRVGIIHKGRLRYEGDIATLQASVREVNCSAAPLPAVLAVPESGSRSEKSDPLVARRALAQHVQHHGYTVLRDGFAADQGLVLSAPPAVWEQGLFPPEAIRRLSLEDIFIAIATEVAFLP